MAVVKAAGAAVPDMLVVMVVLVVVVQRNRQTIQEVPVLMDKAMQAVMVPLILPVVAVVLVDRVVTMYHLV